MARQGTSIRIRADLKDALVRRARDAGTSPAALYERFLDEGLRHEDHPLILFRDGAGGRRPVLAGSRLSVAQVIDTLMATDGDETDATRVRETAEYLDISAAYVSACIRYYADYKEEVDAWRTRAAEATKREHEAWLRAQAILA